MHKFIFEPLGLEVEIGKLARQADGSAWIKCGNNVVLSTVVAAKEEKDFIGFFPLTVEYREKMSAAGKIPGGYIKREGRLSDTEVLTSRLIDRSIRPLFPKYFFNEVQVLSAVYSSDGKFPLRVLSLIGSSLALTLSKIPFSGPVGAVSAIKLDGKWQFNVGFDESKHVESSILITGTADGVTMIEGHCNNVSEEEFVDLMFEAYELIKEQVVWQQKIKEELGVVQNEVVSVFDWSGWEQKVRSSLPENFIESLFTENKEERNVVMKELRSSLSETFAKDIEEGSVSKSKLNFLFDTVLKIDIPDVVARKKVRLDGRPFDKVRAIESEAGLLPQVHGSAVFQRGETQALASLTLGTGSDAQKVDTLFGLKERSFMLHYNFPPFSTGEARPIRGVSRREIGHGYLAESSFYNILPSQDEFPYTIRIISDILESNGSSSMATVCATTLALLDAGVPLKSLVGGIAMGLMQDSSGESHILTDILGIEDAFGLMDFKVTGTDTGIMAIQMDIKAKGLTKELVAQALGQAREARLHIISEIRKTLDKPRTAISEHAPQVVSFTIAGEKIGAVIGPSGKNIKEIIAQTETQIDIDDNGMVRIYAKDADSAAKAEAWVKVLAGHIEPGSEYDGVIKRIAEFGVFVELVPGKMGLLHISKISRDRQQDLEKYVRIGDTLRIKVLAYDKETDRIRLDAESLRHPLEN